VAPLIAAIGAGFYMLHNTLQTNATQMAPAARGLAISLFAFCYFLGQAAGVAACGWAVDEFGYCSGLRRRRGDAPGHRVGLPRDAGKTYRRVLGLPPMDIREIAG